MCGIAAYFVRSSTPQVAATVRSLLERIPHRGPDGDGLQCGELNDLVADGQPARWGLGHQRLAILDLSPAGLQPMASDDRRTWIVFNGEVYNYVEIAQELKRRGHPFHTGTDTEVILAAYREWGTQCVTRFRGMFSFVLIDLNASRAWAVRDRLGIKPLYVWLDSRQAVIASELKQFLAIPEFQPRLHQVLAVDYLCEGLLEHESGETFFQGVHSLTPGHTLEWSLADLPQLAQQQRYWEPSRTTVACDWPEAVERTRTIVQQAIQLRLRSDVPVGTCLSGGIDSSTIVGVASHDFGYRMRTFSAVHNDERIREEHYMDDVIRHCDAEPYKLTLSEDIALADLDTFIYHQDEPVYSLSQHAEYAIMRLAREHGVPVLLNGQGGDETLCGYRKFVFFYWRQLIAQHRWGAALQHGLDTLRYGDRQLFQFWQATRYLPRWLRPRHDLWNDWLRADMRDLRRARWKTAMRGVHSLHEHQWADLRRWSLPVLLRYQDRNSMAHGVEARVPLVDHQFVEWALTLPEPFFFQRGMTKRLLVEAVGDRLPESLRRRRTKLGFDTPQASWMRGRLGMELERRVRDCERLDSILQRKQCAQAFVNYRQGDRAVSHFVLFRIACLAVWLDRFQVQPY